MFLGPRTAWEPSRPLLESGSSLGPPPSHSLTIARHSEEVQTSRVLNRPKYFNFELPDLRHPEPHGLSALGPQRLPMFLP